jgi:lysozyme-like protein
VPSLAELLGYLVQPIGGPNIPILPKAASNATGGSIPGVVGPKGPPLSSPAEMMNALTAIGNAQSEAKLRGAQIEELQRLAKLREQLPGAFDKALAAMGGGTTVSAAPALPDSSAVVPTAWGSMGAAAPDGMSVGGKLSLGQMADMARKAGFAEDKAVQMAAIAMGESGGNPAAYNGRGENSYGLTQINADAHGPVAREALNPQRAMELAFDISKGGTDFSPWSVYKSGAYKQYLPASGAAPMSLAPSAGGGAPAGMVPGGGVQLSPAQLAIARLGMLGRMTKMGDIADPLEKAFYGSPQFKGDVAGAEELAKLRAQLGLAGPIAGAKTEAERAVTEPSDIRIATARAALDAQLKRLEQERAAGLDPVPITVDTPDGGREEIQGTREQAARIARGEAVPELGIAGRNVAPATPGAAVPGAAGELVPGGVLAPPAGRRVVGKPVGVGPIPEGNRLVMLPGGGSRLEPIPGSPTARAAAQSVGAAQQGADIASDEIRRALKLSDDWSTTGFPGALARQVPGTNAFDLGERLSTLKAIGGFAQLQQMRNASPTGGALGQVSDAENRLLSSTLGSLEQAQTKEGFQYNLKRLNGIYQDVVHGAPDQLEKAIVDGSITRAQFDQVMARRKKLTEDGLLLKPIDADTMTEAQAAMQTKGRDAVMKRLMDRGFDVSHF